MQLLSRNAGKVSAELILMKNVVSSRIRGTRWIDGCSKNPNRVAECFGVASIALNEPLHTMIHLVMSTFRGRKYWRTRRTRTCVVRLWNTAWRAWIKKTKQQGRQDTCLRRSCWVSTWSALVCSCGVQKKAVLVEWLRCIDALLILNSAKAEEVCIPNFEGCFLITGMAFLRRCLSYHFWGCRVQ